MQTVIGAHIMSETSDRYKWYSNLGFDTYCDYFGKFTFDDCDFFPHDYCSFSQSQNTITGPLHSKGARFLDCKF